MKNKIKQAASLVLAFLVLGGCAAINKNAENEVLTTVHETLSDETTRREHESVNIDGMKRKTTVTQSETENESTASDAFSSTKGVPSTTKSTTTRKVTTTRKITTTHKVTTTRKVTTTARVTATQKATTTKKVTTTQKAVTTTQKPATTQKTTTAKATTVPVQKDASVIIGLEKINFGCDKKGITDILGSPDETVTETLETGGTVTSLVYSENYGEFAVFQLLDGRFSAIYTVDESVIITDGDSSYSLRAGGDTEISDVKISAYRDSTKGGKAYAVKASYGGFGYYPHELSSLEGQERLVFHTSNAVRAVNGLYAFEYSGIASDCVRKHCKDMSARNYFSHDTPEGLTSAQRMRNNGIEYTSCGENLAAGYLDAFGLVDGWYNSPGHRKNLLDKGFRYLGVCVVGGNESYHIYAGQNFYA